MFRSAAAIANFPTMIRPSVLQRFTNKAGAAFRKEHGFFFPTYYITGRFVCLSEVVLHLDRRRRREVTEARPCNFVLTREHPSAAILNTTQLTQRDLQKGICVPISICPFAIGLASAKAAAAKR